MDKRGIRRHCLLVPYQQIWIKHPDFKPGSQSSRPCRTLDNIETYLSVLVLAVWILTLVCYHKVPAMFRMTKSFIEETSGILSSAYFDRILIIANYINVL